MTTTFNMLSIIKWTATVLLIISVALNSMNVYPLGPIVQVAGGILWSAASIQMRDAALMTTNLVMTSIGIFGLIAYNFW